MQEQVSYGLLYGMHFQTMTAIEYSEGGVFGPLTFVQKARVDTHTCKFGKIKRRLICEDQLQFIIYQWLIITLSFTSLQLYIIIIIPKQN